MNGRLIRLVPISDAMLTASSDAAFPKSGLADAQPKVVWRSPGASVPGVVTIDLNLGDDIAVDAVGVLFTNVSDEATWDVRGATSAAGTGPLATTASRILGTSGAAMRMPAATSQSRYHALAIGTPVSVRYLRISITDTSANLDGFAQAGVLAIGSGSVVPVNNFEFSHGRRVVDGSLRSELPGGETAAWRLGRVPVARVVWSDLTDADLDAMWGFTLAVGESDPLILLEESDSTLWRQEELHYGLLQGLDFYERRAIDKSRYEIVLRNML